MPTFRVHYVYLGHSWEDVEADSAQEAQEAVYDAVYDDIQEVVDCYEVSNK